MTSPAARPGRTSPSAAPPTTSWADVPRQHSAVRVSPFDPDFRKIGVEAAVHQCPARIQDDDHGDRAGHRYDKSRCRGPAVGRQRDDGIAR